MVALSRNTAILEGLRRSRAENRLHHAYILSGPEGGAKLDCVERFAAEIFAEGSGGGLFGGSAPAGDLSQSFRRIQQRNHPDFTVLQPVNEVLGVNEVRELPRLLAFPPLESTQRVVLIAGAGCMNNQAANALLKILEEPPGHTMFFLLCRDPSELLPTIISRCQVLRFAPMAEPELMRSIGESAADPAALSSVVAFAEGSLDRAKILLAQEDGLELRRAAGENLLALWEASPRVPSAVAHWAETLQDEESCRVAIDSWTQLLRDLLFTLSGAQAKDLLFKDLYPRLQALGKAPNDKLWEEAASKSSTINRFRVYREFNGNLRLDLTSLLADLQLISVGKRG
ncbi:MAG: DNA polymerase III subunit [Bacteriovoracia bacterium]